MLTPGVYPAAVTPLDPNDRVDLASLARLLAGFEAAGCAGVVLAGTNGEGPSLSAVEKRDIVRDTAPLAGPLVRIAGVASPSLDEARWLCAQAGKAGASAALVMPPAYFRFASEAGLREWFLRLADASPIPILAYNFPRMTGITLSPEFLGSLAGHERIAGAKDSSGDPDNVLAYRQALPSPRRLFVGDETLLVPALEAGWDGTISGAANVVPTWLVEIVRRWAAGDQDGARVKDRVLAPVLAALRGGVQPALNKALLHALGTLACPAPRLPLETADPTDALAVLSSRLGLRPGANGLAAPRA